MSFLNYMWANRSDVWRLTIEHVVMVAIAILLTSVDVHAIDRRVAAELGMILAASKTHDPIDAHVVQLAREADWPVLTSDPDDLLAIDPLLDLELV